MAIRVLFIGLEPSSIDFGDPEFARTGVDAARIQAGIDASMGRLRGLGYDVGWCGIDAGTEAAATVRVRLLQRPVDCVVIGAGIRLIPGQTPLFEKLVDAVRTAAPGATLAFNTNPGDAAEAVQRWFPQAG